jgi:hypothetical protein
MATPAKFPSEVAERIYQLLEAGKVTLYGPNGTVLYGDQDRLPTTPTICVEAGVTDRALAGAQGPNGRVQNELNCDIIVYYAKVDSNQVTKRAAEQVAEATAQFLDANPRLELSSDGGIVIHGFVTRIDHGYARKQRTLMYGSRLTWVGKTKTMLGV